MSVFFFLKKNKFKYGFTLLEVLLVVAIIAVLAGIVILAINPSRQLAQTRNAERRSDLKQIYNAMIQFYILEGYYPASSTLPITLTEICNTGPLASSSVDVDGNPCGDLINFSYDLVPVYLAAIPADPSGPLALIEKIIPTAWAAIGGNGYKVMVDSTNKVVLTAPQSEIGTMVAIGTTTATTADGEVLLVGAAIGDSCVVGSDCQAGLYCGLDVTLSNQVCTEGVTSVDYCYDNAGCVSGWCNSSNGICKINGDDGTGCGANVECTSVLCDTGCSGWCVLSVRGIGDYCCLDSDCDSGFCDPNSAFCAEPLLGAALGEACAQNSDCVSGLCDTMYYGICTDVGELGYPCLSGADCTNTGYCGGDIWPICTDGSIGSGCSSGTDCALGYCDTFNSFICTTGSIGNYCSSDSECALPLVCDTGYSMQCIEMGTGTLGEICLVKARCQAGLYCGYDFWNTGVCSYGATGVDPCYPGAISSSDQCADGYCDYMSYLCSDGSIGANCMSNSDCAAPNICDVDSTNQCIAPTGAALGEICTAKADCQTGLYCGYPQIGDIGTCTNGLTLFDTCGVGATISEQCADGYCDFMSALCSNGSIGSNCMSNSDCVSSYCDPGNYLCATP